MSTAGTVNIDEEIETEISILKYEVVLMKELVCENNADTGKITQEVYLSR